MDMVVAVDVMVYTVVGLDELNTVVYRIVLCHVIIIYSTVSTSIAFMGEKSQLFRQSWCF
jgi:ABC-type iron transport system FetAB permease component